MTDLLGVVLQVIGCHAHLDAGDQRSLPELHRAVALQVEIERNV